jgi:mersacidin/lichenicidin family type 2 lantibiotic
MQKDMMQKEMIVRAWKDPIFRAGLNEEERARIPPNPAGPPMVELPEAELVNWTCAATCVWFAGQER